MFIKIFQIREKDELNIKFMMFDYIFDLLGRIPSEEYKCVYIGYMNAHDPEEIFQRLNVGQKPMMYQGHSLSVSDIIEIHKNIPEDKPQFLFCDPVGFRELSDFDISRCERMDGVRVVFSEPGHKPYVTFVLDELKHLQNAVSVHGEETLIEEHRPFSDFPRVVLLCNENALLLNMPVNGVYGGVEYRGPLIFAQVDEEGNLCDLTERQINAICSL